MKCIRFLLPLLLIAVSTHVVLSRGADRKFYDVLGKCTGEVPLCISTGMSESLANVVCLCPLSGVAQDATEDQIKRAYRKQAL